MDIQKAELEATILSKKLAHFKELAHQRAIENKRLTKRIKELTKSRNDWKTKSLSHKNRADKYENDLKKTKDKLTAIIEN